MTNSVHKPFHLYPALLTYYLDTSVISSHVLQNQVLSHFWSTDFSTPYPVTNERRVFNQLKSLPILFDSKVDAVHIKTPEVSILSRMCASVSVDSACLPIEVLSWHKS